MNKTYQHKFSDGSTITLAVDLSGDSPIVRSIPPGAMKDRPRAIGREYERWLNSVIIPDMMNNAPIAMVAKVAVAVTNKIK